VTLTKKAIKARLMKISWDLEDTLLFVISDTVKRNLEDIIKKIESIISELK